MKITRRSFLKASGVLALGSSLAGSLASTASTQLDDKGDGPWADGLDGLKTDRWIPTQWRTAFKHEENLWHPQLVKLNDGNLLMSAIVGGYGLTVVVRSTDGGATWSEPVEVSDYFNIQGGGGWGMTQLRSGRLIMSYLDISPWRRIPAWPPASEPRKVGQWPEKGLYPWAWDPEYTRMQLRTAYSDDNGSTWKLSDPIDCSPWIGAITHGSGPIFEVDNTIYMPVWAWFSKDDWGNCALLKSEDGGKTWKPGSVIARADRSKQVEYRETCVQVLPDGEWLAICRANYPNDYGSLSVSMHSARSSDGGRSWSEPVPTFASLGFPRMLLLPDGGLMVYGSYNDGIRNFFSYNKGVTWAFEDILFWRDSRYGYGILDHGSPSAVVLSDTEVLVCYYTTAQKDKNWGFMDPRNHVESVLVKRVAWDAEAVLVR